MSILPLLAASALAAVQSVTPPEGLDQALEPRRVALVVGVQDYEDAGLQGLQYTVADAHAFASVLVERGGFDTVEVLEGRVFTTDFWRAWDLVTAELHTDDLFVVYFAGHGTLTLSSGSAPAADERGTRLYLLFSNSHLDAPRATGIPLSVLEARIQQVKAEHQVLVVDSCYSGLSRSAWTDATRQEAQSMRGPVPAPSTRVLRHLDAEMFAAHVNEPALEDPALGHGIYTWYLMEALGGPGDLDGDGLVTVWEAHEHAASQTVRHTEGVQVPWIRITRVGTDDIYLAGDAQSRRRAEKALVVGADFATLSIDGQVQDGVAVVSPGWHQVTLSQGDQVLVNRTMLLRRGAHLDADRVLATRGEWELGAGPAVASSEVVTTPRIRLEGWRWSGRALGVRAGVGVEAGVGRGSLVHMEPLVEGQVLARGACFAGDRWAAGPILGAGVLWRAPQIQAQAGPVVALGAGLHHDLKSVYLSLEASAWLSPLWSVNPDQVERWTLSPVASASLGWRR